MALDFAGGAGVNWAPALKLQTYQLQSYHTPPEIASFSFLVEVRYDYAPSLLVVSSHLTFPTPSYIFNLPPTLEFKYYAMKNL